MHHPLNTKNKQASLCILCLLCDFELSCFCVLALCNNSSNNYPHPVLLLVFSYDSQNPMISQTSICLVFMYMIF
ncbi:hypothetical protein AAHE18_17G054700 [Arachis hypogaea]